ncbi:DUF2946 family protein [Pseudomonas putida]|uniref:DUF2946 family protein n=1 Tax=Pseudomonas putida TaxID=303 RepID=UPI00274BD090|nr:DUF2946 family protein [Pseudomonas putida]MDP9523141.1 hypothetical protein [Pseudomonas putida]
MHRPAGRRHAFAWLLYASVLFAALHCGLGHGQASGLTLNGAGGAFCGHAGATPSPLGFEQWLGDTLAAGTTPDCPLCSHIGLAFMPLPPDLPVARATPDISLPVSPAAWPRRFWPAANPRASPALA